MHPLLHQQLLLLLQRLLLLLLLLPQLHRLVLKCLLLHRPGDALRAAHPLHPAPLF